MTGVSKEVRLGFETDLKTPNDKENRMLVLSRNIDEVIRIGEDIKITVVGFKGGHTVRLGIDAPANVTVHREEIYQAILEENRTRGCKVKNDG